MQRYCGSGYIEGEQLMYVLRAVGDILGYFLTAEGECVEELEITKNRWASRLMNWRSCLPSSAWLAVLRKPCDLRRTERSPYQWPVTEETTARAVLALT